MFTPWCVRRSCRIRKFLNRNCYDIFYCCSNSPRLTFDVLSFLCANVTPTITMVNLPPKKCTGIENGCTEAEFLAIDDEDFQHKRLVRFYKNSGFKIIKYVGEDFQSIPDRMVWGGCGTLMRGNIKDDLLPLWSSLFIKATEREKKINKV